MKFIHAVAAASLALAAMTGTAAAQDVEAGKTVFKKCAACHNADKAENKVGPHLVGVVGREIGSVEGFKYSKANAEFHKTHPVWTEELLTEYLANPRGVIKGTTMAFAGLKKPEEIANVIAYLKSVAPAQ